MRPANSFDRTMATPYGKALVKYRDRHTVVVLVDGKPIGTISHDGAGRWEFAGSPYPYERMPDAVLGMMRRRANKPKEKMTITCYGCGRIIKGTVIKTNPPNISIRLGIDFPKSFHPTCYALSEVEAAKKLRGSA